MQNAQKRDACKAQKFWFRKSITTHVSPPEANECCKVCDVEDYDMYTLMTLNEIINGKVNTLVVKFCLKITFSHKKFIKLSLF